MPSLVRTNHPVTQCEFPFPAGQTLVSTTDLKGRITYCNASFIEVSGFTREELLGQPHNLVRHPDMPEEAFRDLWSTISSGHPWTGTVKNRRKNGDHYWVLANATPLVIDGRVTGYLSVRMEMQRMRSETDNLAAGNQDLSSRTESQASSLEETAAAMEQITVTLQQGSASARTATDLAHEAVQVSERSSDAVQQVNANMQSISESSRRIDEIKGLIEDSAGKVAHGNRITESALSTMEESLEKVRGVTALIDEMTVGAQQQASGMTQIKIAVDQLETITQQNAGMVKGLATSASTLQTQANNVEASLQVMRLSRHEVSRAVDAVALRQQMRAIASQPAAGCVPFIPMTL